MKYALLVVVLVFVSGCALHATGPTAAVTVGRGQKPPAVAAQEMLALVDSLRRIVQELEMTNEAGKRRELALKAMDLVKAIDVRLREVMR